MNKKADKIRNEVARAYGDRVTQPKNAGCCSKRANIQKGLVVKLANYSSEELNALPPEAVVNSFGCGNPVSFAGIKAGDVIVDLGSGAGIDLFLAAKKAGPSGRAIGIEMTDEMIAKANKTILDGKFKNVEVRKGIIEKLPVKDNSVDWIISNCVINLSPEKAKVFAEIARVLKPGGQMLISDIVAKDLPEDIRQLSVAYSACMGGAIPEEEYLSGLSAAGLVDLEVKARMVYNASQLELAISTTLGDLDISGLDKSRLHKAVQSLEGNVWSAKVYGRKPL